jgi:hypothetical protein
MLIMSDKPVKTIELEGVITVAELEALITKVVKANSVLDPETVEVFRDPDNREVIRTIAKGLTPTSATTLARLGRMIDDVEYSLGKLVLRVMIFGSVGVLLWLLGSKMGVIGGE